MLSGYLQGKATDPLKFWRWSHIAGILQRPEPMAPFRNHPFGLELDNRQIPTTCEAPFLSKDQIFAGVQIPL